MNKLSSVLGVKYRTNPRIKAIIDTITKYFLIYLGVSVTVQCREVVW